MNKKSIQVETRMMSMKTTLTKRFARCSITIARDALARELVLPFVRNKLSQGENRDLSVCNYVRYISRIVIDPNYLLICDIVFEFLDATIMYREGIRNSDASYIHSGRAKVAKLWCSRHHPSYREIEMAGSLLYGMRLIYGYLASLIIQLNVIFSCLSQMVRFLNNFKCYFQGQKGTFWTFVNLFRPIYDISVYLMIVDDVRSHPGHRTLK